MFLSLRHYNTTLHLAVRSNVFQMVKAVLMGSADDRVGLTELSCLSKRNSKVRPREGTSALCVISGSWYLCVLPSFYI